MVAKANCAVFSRIHGAMKPVDIKETFPKRDG